MADADIQLRVNRLLAGRATFRDLERIFLWLRFRSFGYSSIKDVGDFTGHLEDRNRGSSYESVQRLYDMLRLTILQIEAQNSGRHPRPDLDILRRGSVAALQNLSAEVIKSNTGMRKNRAIKELKRAIEKILAYYGINIELKSTLTASEEISLKAATSVLSIKDAYTDDQLIDELANVLFRHRFINRNDMLRIFELREMVAVFAVEKMHLANVQVEQKDIVSLKAGVDFSNSVGNLVVRAVVPISSSGKARHMSAPLFSTMCRADIWCETELMIESWEFPVELGTGGKLNYVD